MQALFSFGLASRINKPADYKAIFRSAGRLHAPFFILLVKHNLNGQARLGLALAKKYIPRSVDRSRMKRLFRESFRLHQSQLPPIDVVILAKKGMATLSTIQLRNDVEKQWDELIKRYNG